VGFLGGIFWVGFSMPSLGTRVADPHHFNAAPDLPFHFNADPDPYFKLNADPYQTFYFNADPVPAPRR
jgi:hypothetical protein